MIAMVAWVYLTRVLMRGVVVGTVAAFRLPVFHFFTSLRDVAILSPGVVCVGLCGLYRP